MFWFSLCFLLQSSLRLSPLSLRSGVGSVQCWRLCGGYGMLCRFLLQCSRQYCAAAASVFLLLSLSLFALSVWIHFCVHCFEGVEHFETITLQLPSHSSHQASPALCCLPFFSWPLSTILMMSFFFGMLLVFHLLTTAVL